MTMHKLYEHHISLNCEGCLLSDSCGYFEQDWRNNFHCPGLSGDDWLDELVDLYEEDDLDKKFKDEF